MASKQSDEQSIVEQKVHEAAVCRLDFLSSNLSSLCREKKKKISDTKKSYTKNHLSPPSSMNVSSSYIQYVTINTDEAIEFLEFCGSQQGRYR